MLSTAAKLGLLAVVLGVGYVVTRPKPKPKRVVPRPTPIPTGPETLVPPTAPTIPWDEYWTPEIQAKARDLVRVWMEQNSVAQDQAPNCPSMYDQSTGTWLFQGATADVSAVIWPEQTWPAVPGQSPDWQVGVQDKVLVLARQAMCPNWSPVT